MEKQLAQGRKTEDLLLPVEEARLLRPVPEEFPPEVILLTTLETNRDEGYEAISKAPPPSVRYEQFRALKLSQEGRYHRARARLRPDDVRHLDSQHQPEYVWLGFNSKPDPWTCPSLRPGSSRSSSTSSPRRASRFGARPFEGSKFR